MAVVHRFIRPERRERPILHDAGGRRQGAEIVILPCVRRESFGDWTTGIALDRVGFVQASTAADEPLS